MVNVMPNEKNTKNSEADARRKWHSSNFNKEDTLKDDVSSSTDSETKSTAPLTPEQLKRELEILKRTTESVYTRNREKFTETSPNMSAHERKEGLMKLEYLDLAVKELTKVYSGVEGEIQAENHSKQESITKRMREARLNVQKEEPRSPAPSSSKKP